MTKNLAISINNLVLKVGDKIRLVGKRPINPIVTYTDSMDSLLENNPFTIYHIDAIRSCTVSGLPIIRVAGWNWDRRNICKIIEDEDNSIPDPILFNFDISKLDIP